jgi:hypothetical protein
MSIPHNQDLYVVPRGEITLTVEFQTWLGSGNNQPGFGCAADHRALAGGWPDVGPTSSVTEIDRATYSYQWLPPQSTTAGTTWRRGRRHGRSRR